MKYVKTAEACNASLSIVHVFGSGFHMCLRMHSLQTADPLDEAGQNVVWQPLHYRKKCSDS